MANSRKGVLGGEAGFRVWLTEEKGVNPKVAGDVIVVVN